MSILNSRLYRFNDIITRGKFVEKSAEKKENNKEIKNVYADVTKSFKVIFGIEKQIKGNSVYFEIETYNKDNKFSESYNNTYDKVFGDSPDGLLNSLLSFVGVVFRPTWLYRRIWKDGEPLSFNLNIQLLAENDSIEEVIRPAREILKLAVPSRGESRGKSSASSGLANVIDKIVKGLIILPPGYSYIKSKWLDEVKSYVFSAELSNLMYLRIGNLLILKNVFISNITINWDLDNLDINGLPLSADLNLSCSCHSLYTTNIINDFIPKRTENGIIIGNDSDMSYTELNITQILKDLFGKEEESIPKAQQQQNIKKEEENKKK